MRAGAVPLGDDLEPSGAQVCGEGVDLGLRLALDRPVARGAVVIEVLTVLDASDAVVLGLAARGAGRAEAVPRADRAAGDGWLMTLAALLR